MKRNLASGQGKFYSIFGGNKLTQNDVQAITNYANALKSGVGTGKAWQTTMSGCSVAAKQYVVSAKRAGQSTDELVTGLKTVPKATTAASVGLKALSIAGNMLAMWGISEVIKLISDCVTASDRLRESAQELGSAFSSTKSEISDYKSKIEDLYKTINDSTSSYEDTYNARQELLKIQGEMIDKFGDEAEAVNLVTDAINGQTDALDTLTEKKWQETVNEFNSGADKKWTQKVGDAWANLWSGNSNNFDRMIDEMENTEVSFHLTPLYGNEDYTTFIEKLQKDFNVSFVSDGTDDVITLSGDLDDIYGKLLDIQALAKDIGIDDSLITNLSDQADATKKTLESYEDIYNQHILYDKILNTDAYEESFKKINDEYKKYQKAFASGDEEVINKAKQNFAEIVQGATEGVDDKSVVDYFNTMYPDLQDVVGAWEFEVKFKAAIEDDNDNFENEVKDYVGQFNTSDDILNYNPKIATEEQKDAYIKLNDIAEQYNLTLEQLVEKLIRMGLISLQVKGDLLDKLIPNGATAGITASINNALSQVNPDVATEWVKGLTEEEARLANSPEFEQALEDRKNKIVEEATATKQSIEDELKSLEKGGNVNLTLRPTVDTSLLNEAGWDAGDGTATVFSSTYSNEDGSIAINFTPIIADPKTGEYLGVMSPNELQSYAEGVIAGTRKDDLNLQIGGEFTGKDAIDQAVNAANNIHDLHEKYFVDTEGNMYQLTLVTEDYNDALQKVKDSQNELGNETSILSFSDAWEQLKNSTEDATKGLADDLTKLAESGQLTAEALSEADTSEFFKNAGISAEEAVRQINALISSSTQLQSMSAQISKMSDMLANKKNGTTASASDLAGFDATVKGLESWEEFERVMGSSTSTMEECQQAADALATEWVNNGNFLANLTAENKDYYITQLDNMGVMNAEALVTDRLTTAQLVAENTEKALSAATADLSDKQASYTQRSVDAVNATYENSAALANQEGMTNVARVALAELVAQQTIFSNQDLGVSDKIAALGELAGAYMGAAAQASFLNKTQGGLNSNYRISPEEAWAQVKEEFSRLDTTIVTPVIKPTGSSTYKNNSSGSKDSKTTIDWISRLLDVLQKKIDQTKAKFDNLFTIKTKNNNLNKQINLTKNLLTATTKAAERYKKAASNVKLSDDLKKKVRNGSYDINEYGSKTADAINKYKEYYDQYKELLQKADELTTDIRNLQIEQYQLVVDNASAKIARSQARAELDAGNYKEQNKHLEYQKKYLKEQYEAEIEIAKVKKDKVEVARLEAELQQKLRDYEKEAFDNIQSTFEYQIGYIGNTIDDLDNKISAVENKGLIADASFYNTQASVHEQILSKLGDEKKELTEQLKNIKAYTPAWYDAIGAIQSVEDEIANTNTKISEMKQAINDVANILSGNILNSFHDLNEEADTLITLLGDNLSDDKLGNLTKEGIAALGLYNQQMNVSKASAENVQNEIRSIQNAINNGTYTKFIDSNGMERQFESIYQAKDRIKELQESYRSEIQSTYQYESKIVDLMKQKYQSELNYVKELIDKKKELLSAEQDLYQYSRDIKNQVDGINSIKKQLSALQGDTSLENKSRVQKLEKQLKDQQDDLKDKEYERYISDTQNMLDNLSAEYQQLIESVSKDRDTLLKEGNQLIASNGTQIQQTISETASEYGYQMSAEMQTAASSITTGLSGIKTVLDSIETHLKTRIVDTDYAAVQSSNNGSNSKSSSSSGNKNNITDSDEELKASVVQYIDSHLNKGLHDQNYYGSLNQYIYGLTNGKILSVSEQVELAKLLGVKVKSDLSGKNDKDNILKALKKLGWGVSGVPGIIDFKSFGFSSGGIIDPNNILKRTGEKGYIIANPHEAVLTEPQWESIRDLGTAMTNMDYSMFKSNMPYFDKNVINVPTAIDRNIGGITYGGNNQINIELPNVTNYEDFMRKFQSDPKAEQLVQHMTASALNGSRLGKNTIRF